jgi:segregation and condensation protein B
MLNNFLELDRETQKRIIEVIIFASEEPIPLQKLSEIILKNRSNNKLDNFSEQNHRTESNNLNQHILHLINEIRDELEQTQRPYTIVDVAGGFTFATTPEFGKVLSLLPSFKNKKRLTKAMLETLAIIAYQQPITKPEIEEIRGTNSSEIVNSLLEKNLIQIVGRKDSPGRPFLFGTTNEFLKLFGLNSLDELPNLNEIKSFVNEKNRAEEITLKIELEEENKIDGEQNATE